MKINWKVRFNNPIFVVQVLGSVFVPILVYFGLELDDLTSWAVLGDVLLRAVENPFVVGTALFSLWNAINDPTTKGLGDSATALTYTKPK